jgi:hypothetical protein
MGKPGFPIPCARAAPRKLSQRIVAGASAREISSSITPMTVCGGSALPSR